NRLPIFSFVLDGIPAHDIATLLDEAGIAVRAGHHCAQILHQSFGVSASTRASLTFYNTTEEIDRLIASLKNIVKLFARP
ncbi:MAG: aminotransferase class V-fold PLP-dependent enzyme, partial [bacterium]|nr:aminotransferase class V-fold PLP-dependent enzyme [bacterium]